MPRYPGARQSRLGPALPFPLEWPELPARKAEKAQLCKTGTCAGLEGPRGLLSFRAQRVLPSRRALGRLRSVVDRTRLQQLRLTGRDAPRIRQITVAACREQSRTSARPPGPRDPSLGLPGGPVPVREPASRKGKMRFNCCERGQRIPKVPFFVFCTENKNG